MFRFITNLKKTAMEIVLEDKQSLALNLLKQGRNVLVTGPGGSGKSLLVNVVVDAFRKMGKKVGVTSTTGQSAHLIGGSTLHSFLGISLGDMSRNTLFERIISNSKKKKNWIETDLLVIDETSMLDPMLFEKLDSLAKKIRRIDRPFGGIQLLLAGDFYQLPVVNSDKFVFEAECWTECINEIVVLTDIKRQSDGEFRDILNRLRIGNGTRDDFEYLKRLGEKEESDMNIRPTKIFCMNEHADIVNAKELAAISTANVYVYNMQISKPKLVTRDVTKKCNAVKTLKLCEGAEVLLLVNLDQEGGLINGSRGTVVYFTKQLRPVVRFINGKTRAIDYNTWEINEDGRVIAAVTQIPLRLAYAITIHKSQGMTLESASIDLSGVFEYGQAYVALSRVRDPVNLIVKNVSSKSFRVHPKARAFYETL